MTQPSQTDKNETLIQAKSKLIIAAVFSAVIALGFTGVVLGSMPTADNAEQKPAVEAPKKQQTLVTPHSTPVKTAIPPAILHEKSSRQATHKTPVLIPENLAPEAVGVAFVRAAIAPLDYELNERFWGWRPNDILNVTDNINNYQLGVLEVTRRTVERLADNISRTGSTASFDKHLENARSTCFVIGAQRYMFPSPEGKYEDGLEDLETYRQKLEDGSNLFYTRADNLIPLLLDYEHLLGSCDDNLVKAYEENGELVSYFSADDYFYYAKGVAAAMATVLEAVEKDFHTTLDRRNCLPVLHHAIESCKHAAHIEPILILDSDLDGSFANHRANMAAQISHARFYLSILIKTLST
jgi:hypothetical protein